MSHCLRVFHCPVRRVGNYRQRQPFHLNQLSVSYFPGHQDGNRLFPNWSSSLSAFHRRIRNCSRIRFASVRKVSLFPCTLRRLLLTLPWTLLVVRLHRKHSILILHSCCSRLVVDPEHPTCMSPM